MRRSDRRIGADGAQTIRAAGGRGAADGSESLRKRDGEAEDVRNTQRGGFGDRNQGEKRPGCREHFGQDSTGPWAMSGYPGRAV